MPEFTPLKEFFNEAFLEEHATALKAVYKKFDAASFCALLGKKIPDLALKERVSAIAHAYHQFLPGPYSKNIRILLKLLGPPFEGDEGIFYYGFKYMPSGDYIALYGLHEPELSFEAMAAITQSFSSEFAIRPFLEAEPDLMLSLLKPLVKAKSHHLRRWVSESTRPRLPWASHISWEGKQKKVVMKFLDQLKSDPSLYVRRSVANHLNDIGKSAPKELVDTLKAWKLKKDDPAHWTLKHALRSLIKEGNKEALALIGIVPAKLKIKQFDLSAETVSLGEPFTIDLILQSKSKGTDQKIIIDWVLHLLKQNGTHKAKVFKGKELILKAGEELSVQKKFHLKPINTRKYYQGVHYLELQINGASFGREMFTLLLP